LYADYSQGFGHNGLKATDYSGQISHDIKITNCEFYHLGDSAILTNSNTYNIEISNNTFHNVGLSKRGYCLYIGGHNQTIQKNICYEAYGIGIQIQNSVHHISAVKNKIYNNGHSDYGAGYDDMPSGGTTRGDGIYMAYCSNSCIIENNLSFNNFTHGIRLDGDCSTAQVINNTVYHNNSKGIDVEDSSTQNAIIRNNISYLNGTNAYIISGNTQDHNLFGIDPKFVDAANGNFHLLSNSPAIDTGATVSVEDDYDGNARPYNSVYDIGAYEYGAQDTTPPAPPSLIKVQ
jgi:parallel beta-helix repeat protein